MGPGSRPGRRRDSAIPRRDAPEVLRENCPSRKRGSREHRVHAAPAVSCAKLHKKTHTSIQVQRRQSGIPCAMVLTAYIVLSPATGLFCHRRLRKLPFANLTPASGRQDHTSSPSASHAVRQRRIRVHRIPPRVRDDREPPLSVGRDGNRYSFDLGVRSTMITATHWHDGQNQLRGSPHQPWPRPLFTLPWRGIMHL
jgi:hypothetical protein